MKALVDGGSLTFLSKSLESGNCLEKSAQLVAEIAKVGEYSFIVIVLRQTKLPSTKTSPKTRRMTRR